MGERESRINFKRSSDRDEGDFLGEKEGCGLLATKRYKDSRKDGKGRRDKA